MKCLSRSTFGVIIGGLNIFGFACTVIYIIAALCNPDDFTPDNNANLKKNTTIADADLETNKFILGYTTFLCILLVLFIAAIILAVLLIIGILKKRSKLMRPWIYTAMFGIGVHLIRIIFDFCTGFGDGIGSVFDRLLGGMLVLGFQCLVFYPIYTLYKDYTDLTIAQDNCNISDEVY